MDCIESLNEDRKKHKKLRKLLRQIVHLQLQTRPLNDEEKIKVSKRENYMEELRLLNLKYNDTDFLLDKSEATFESTFEQTNDSIPNSSMIEQETDENVIKQVDELSEMFDAIAINASESEQVEPIEQIEQMEPEQTKQNKKKKKKSQKQEEKTEEPVKNEKTLPVLETKQVKARVEEKIIPQIPAKQKVKPKPKFSFETIDVANAHEDLIVSVDICGEFGLVVTGSRDTTIRVWTIYGKQLHSFGGHSSTLTCVKFWPYKNYKNIIESLKRSDEYSEEVLPDLEESDNEEDENAQRAEAKKYPLILSCSLDCSLRIWSIYKGRCIKQFYLYNPINNIDILDSSFLVALDAGKIEFWTNLKQIFDKKIFDDTEMVCCIRFLQKEKFCALARSGIFKIASIDSTGSLSLIKEINLHKIMSGSFSAETRKNFSCFEALSEERIIAINDNQSFVVLFDFSNDETKFKLIATNSSSFGFTNCFTKLNSRYFISGYNIDDGSSVINVFNSDLVEGRAEDEMFSYEFTMDDKNDNTNCISSLACTKLSSIDKSTAIASGSSKSLKIWSIKDDNSKKNQVKVLKMHKQFNLHSEMSNNEDESDADEKEKVDKNEQESDESEDNHSAKRYCAIQ